jgi:hypothetical protein
MILVLPLLRVIFTVVILLLGSVTSAQAQIVISEVYPAPLPGENEWIEFVNISDETISLTEWKIEDLLSTPKVIYSFETLSLVSGEIYVATISGQLNNGGDGVVLKDSNGTIIDQMSYQSSSSDMSWTFIDGQFEETTPNPFVLLEASPVPTPSPNSTPQITPSPIPSDEDLFGKLALVSLLSCPDSSDEWIEIQNISNSEISGDLSILDNQSNRFDFHIEMGVHSVQKVYLDRHIFNNGGDKISVADSKGVVFSYDIPSCSTKGQIFYLDEQTEKLVLQTTSLSSENELKQETESDSKVLGNSTDVTTTNTTSQPRFQLSKEYIASLRLLEESSTSSPANEIPFEQDIDKSSTESSNTPSLLTIVVLIGSGIIISLLGIMYSYGRDKSKIKAID